MFKHLTSALLFLGGLTLVAGLAGCRGDADSSTDESSLEEKLERRAAARPPKASLRLGVIHHLEDVSAGGPAEVTRDDGTLEIQEAYLVLSAIEAHACVPGVDDYDAPDAPTMLNDLSDLVVSPARAHVPSSATRLGTPFVEDLLAEGGRAQIIGAIAPPPAAYCRLHAIVAPADRDVANPTSVATETIRGESLLIRGRWRPSDGDEWQTFEMTTDATRAIELRAVDPRTGEHPLVLEKPGASAMILIDKRIDPSVFDVSVRDADAADTILERLASRFQIHTFQ